MKSKALNIHEFDMGIYPRKLWVVKTNNPILIRDFFYDGDGAELSGNQTFDNISAFVLKVIQKETMDFGYIVCVIQKIGISTIAHEATHVTLLMCEDLGLQITNDTSNEHIAYLNGWISDKIWRVK